MMKNPEDTLQNPLLEALESKLEQQIDSLRRNDMVLSRQLADEINGISERLGKLGPGPHQAKIKLLFARAEHITMAKRAQIAAELATVIKLKNLLCSYRPA